MRVYIFKSILNGRLIHIKIERQLMYFIIIWTASVCWTAISTANYIKHSNIVYYSIELRDTVLRDVKLIGKNSTYSFLSLSTDSTIKIINNEEILSYTKKIK